MNIKVRIFSLGGVAKGYGGCYPQLFYISRFRLMPFDKLSFYLSNLGRYETIDKESGKYHYKYEEKNQLPKSL